MKKSIFIIAIFVVIILGLSLIVFSNKINSKDYNVSIRDYNFEPKQLVIKAGDRVVWTNLDKNVHSIIPNQNDNLENNYLYYGQTFSHTFHLKGVYQYHCDGHENMTGTIVVE